MSACTLRRALRRKTSGTAAERASARLSTSSSSRNCERASNRSFFLLPTSTLKSTASRSPFFTGSPACNSRRKGGDVSRRTVRIVDLANLHHVGRRKPHAHANQARRIQGRRAGHHQRPRPGRLLARRQSDRRCLANAQRLLARLPARKGCSGFPQPVRRPTFLSPAGLLSRREVYRRPESPKTASPPRMPRPASSRSSR